MFMCVCVCVFKIRAFTVATFDVVRSNASIGPGVGPECCTVGEIQRERGGRETLRNFKELVNSPVYSDGRRCCIFQEIGSYYVCPYVKELGWQLLTSVRLKQSISNKAETQHKVPARATAASALGSCVFTFLAAQMSVTGFCVAVLPCVSRCPVMGPLANVTAMVCRQAGRQDGGYLDG